MFEKFLNFLWENCTNKLQTFQQDESTSSDEDDDDEDWGGDTEESGSESSDDEEGKSKSLATVFLKK